jgi:FkbM family methyltransferase
MKQSYLLLVLLTSSLIHAYTIKDRFDADAYAHFLQPYIKPGSLVFDVGAHQGTKAAAFLSLGARVVCFEPQPHLQEQLKQQFAHCPNVAVEPVAVGAEPGVLPFYQCTTDTLSTFSREWIEQSRFSDGSCGSFAWDKVLSVPIVTLDEMIHRYGIPTFCKIDVENFEHEVLKGLSTPITLVSFEYACETEHNSVACLDRLCELGYRKFNFVIAESTEFITSEWLTRDELLSALAEIKSHDLPVVGRLLWGDIYAYYE